MDLITEPWLPVMMRAGRKTKISLLGLLDDDIADVAWPRADFQGAAWQFLIGLMQCTIAPEDDEAWEDVWERGIASADWQQALQSISPVMQFGQQKPAFLQSFDPLDCESIPISGLLIEAPGGNTIKLNKDHFVKRHCVERICLHCAVMALFAVQTNSPAGGAGYRVGLRGGGPLTTLVVAVNDREIPLWKKLWLNVLEQDVRPLPQQFQDIFPWLTSTKTSEKAGRMVTPENAHPLQAYWGMPRRIELDFEHTEPGKCDLCGEYHDGLLLQMRTKNYGVQYDGWLHPLSPYRQALKDASAPRLALKGQPGGLSYKDWPGLMLESEDKFNRMQPARVVRASASRFFTFPTGLWCFAWDMDNAKARCWYQHRVPLIHTSSPELFNSVIQVVLQLAAGSLATLRKHLKKAWFESPDEAKADFSQVDTAFWQETESVFLALIDSLLSDPKRENAATRRAIRDWERDMYVYVFTVFDREALTDPDCPDDILLRQLAARRSLNKEYCKQKARKDVLALSEEQKEIQHG